MNSDYINYAFLLLKKNNILFYLNKIKNKIVSIFLLQKSRYSRTNYPNYLKDFYLPKNINFINKYRDVDFTNTLKSLDIKLASGYKNIVSNINWNLNFRDPEDLESLHRWGWFLWILSKKNISENEIKWSLLQINNWVEKFHNTNNKKIINFNELYWETYTVSERVSNIIIASLFFDIKLNNKILLSIFEQSKIIFNRLEFFGKNNTGNHIINNIRGIYLAGNYFEISFYKKISLIILKKELKKIIPIKGFVREGSSHYQFIVTRWLIEIYIVAKIYNDEKMLKFIESYVFQSLNACNFFLVNKDKELIIPLFGDISPDFEPDWIINIFNSKLFNKENIYSNLFSLNNIYKSLNKNFSIDYNFQPRDTTLVYKDIGWYKIFNSNHLIYMKNNMVEPIKYPTHEHDDQGHFVYYYKKNTILNDKGRYTYLTDNFKLSKHHNVVSINNNFIKPSMLKYKNIYEFNSKLIYKSIKSKSFLFYKTDAFRRVKINNYTRTIYFDNNIISINDKFIIRTKKNNIIKRYFHFTKEVNLISNDNNYYIKINKNLGKLIIKNKETKINIIEDIEDDICNYSTKYGEVINSKTLILENNISETTRLNLSIEWATI